MVLPAIAAGAMRIGAMFTKGVGVTAKATGRGISKGGNNLKKVILKKTKVKRENISRDKLLNKRINERRRRREKESLLESFKKRGKSGITNIPGKSLFENALDFVAVLLIGWLTDKLPQIIKWIEDLIIRIQLLIDSLKRFVKNLGDWIKSIGKVVISAAQNWLSFDFEDKSGKIKSAMDEMESAFKGMESAFEDAKSAVGGDMEEVGGSVASGDLFDIISRGEGGYNSVNRGNAGDTPGGARSVLGKDLTEMTVSEVMNNQYPNGAGLFAVGKYQIIPDTMKGFVRRMGINGDDKFDASTQEKFKDYVINFKRPEVGRYIRGQSNNRAEAAQELAREFASVGLSYAEAGKSRGQSRYAGSAGNRASITPESIEAALDRARQEQSSNPGSGDGRQARGANQTPAYQRAVTVGRALEGQGYRAWQHPDFNVHSGYTGSGRERVMRRSYSSYHNYGEALDYPLSHNSEAQLNKLAAYFRQNKSALGIAEILWKTSGHYDHLHVSFKGGGSVDRVPIAGNIDMGAGVGQPQNTILIIEEEAPPPMMMGGSGGSSPVIVMGESLNSIIKKQLLTSLAYT